MLIGMGLLKTRVLTAERSVRFYAILAAAGLGLGLPIIGAGIGFNFASEWSVEHSMFLGYQFNYWGSVVVGLSYLAIVMLIVRTGLFAAAQRGLAAFGRMAFTNYLGQTLICTTLFYGHGFGLYGKVERWQQFLIAVLILGVQIAISVFWLRRFRFGPLEWLWRSLTYLRKPPMRIRN
jgi:uncharacterized protein